MCVYDTAMALPWACHGVDHGTAMGIYAMSMALIDTLGLDRSYAVRRGKQHP